MRLIVATKNEGKMKEFRAVLSGTGWEVCSMKDIGLDIEVEEDGATFEENAMKKAETVMSACGEVTIADDSGLCVDALNGDPGVYSARYAGEPSDDHANNLKLLEKMQGITNRNAHFTCVLALAFPDGRREYIKEYMHGIIGHNMRGENGFGYDVLFELENGLTTAQIPMEDKNKISHRGKALEKLKTLLEQL